MNSASVSTCASLMPGPKTLTFDASPTSCEPTTILNGLLGICLPFFVTLTKCSPTSLGVNVIPAGLNGTINEFPTQTDLTTTYYNLSTCLVPNNVCIINNLKIIKCLVKGNYGI